MKTIASFLSLLALLGATPARSDWKDDVFTDITKSAPRSTVIDAVVTNRTVFDDIRDSAPVKAPDRIDDGFTGE